MDLLKCTYYHVITQILTHIHRNMAVIVYFRRAHNFTIVILHPTEVGLSRSKTEQALHVASYILLNRFISIFYTQNIPLVQYAYVTTIISMSLSPSIALFPTHLHLPPSFPTVYVYIITLLVFCKIIFSLMRTQDWVEMSELPDNNICPTFWLVEYADR